MGFFFEEIRLSKLKTGSCSFGGNKNGRKIVGIYFRQKFARAHRLNCLPPIRYLFHCSIQNNAGGDETTFAFAVTHHQNLPQG
jgi:hypothetical protein